MVDTSIIGKILISGTLELISPLIIGTGDSQSDIDLEVLKDAKGVPYIPGTGFAGALRHYFAQWAIGADSEQVEFFWGIAGDEAKDTKQSAIAVSDVTLHEWSIAIRDGVTINGLTGMAEDGEKYTYEVVDRGAKAHFKLEVTLRQVYEQQDFLKIIAFLVQGLKDGDIQFGAMTAKGFGEVRLLQHSSIMFDFTKSSHVLAWLERNLSAGDKLDLLSAPTYSKGSDIFSVDAWFALKSSLIVRSYNVSSSDDDAVQMQSGGKWVVPGTSIKGALHGRACDIGRQLGQQDNTWLHSFVGFAENEDKEQAKIKSKLWVKECYFENATAVQQMRIRIDRFTGGTMKTALFSTKPVWCKQKQEPVLNIRLMIKKYQPWEVGLLMMLVKDLWTGNLALGGEKAIGRGVLQGISATLSDGTETWMLEQTEKGLHIEGNKERLEDFAKSFVDRINKVGGENE